MSVTISCRLALQCGREEWPTFANVFPLNNTCSHMLIAKVYKNCLTSLSHFCFAVYAFLRDLGRRWECSRVSKASAALL